MVLQLKASQILLMGKHETGDDHTPLPSLSSPVFRPLYLVQIDLGTSGSS